MNSTLTESRTVGRRRGDDPCLGIAPVVFDQAHDRLIADSHLRCLSAGLSRVCVPDLQRASAISPSAPGNDNRLLSVAVPMMEMLYAEVANSRSVVALTNACGTVLHTVGDSPFMAEVAKVALCPGTNWSESTRGTNGIGTALMSEIPTVVHADEHFLYAHDFLTSSAVPLFDHRGDVLGVLEVTGDRRGYHRHTMGLVRIAASMAENHYLSLTQPSSLIIHLHERAEFLGSLMDGRLVVRRDGRVVGANRNALDRLGLSHAAVRACTVMSLLGKTVDELASHFADSRARALEVDLGRGVSCQLQARFDWSKWHASNPSIVAVGHVSAGHATAPASRCDDEAPVTRPPDADGPGRASGPSCPAPRASRIDLRPSALSQLETGDPQMHAVVGKVRKVLDRGIPVLVLGETGTGKELLARALHLDSRRADQPFIAVNCASIPETLIEAELFGYERGAFTGARAQGAPGKFVQADGGTLLLDEIGDMSLALQARLLRVLQERTVTPLGGQKPVPVDVMLVCATNCNLLDMADARTFREDLYYRINGLCVKLPALRVRQDLLVLAGRLCNPPGARRTIRLAPAVEALFMRYRWPGNVRQLANLLRTAVAMCEDDDLIRLEHLPDDFLDHFEPFEPPTAGTHAVARSEVAGLQRSACQRTMEEMEIDTIRNAVDAADGNISRAAKALHISRNTIYRKLHVSAA